MGSRSSLPSYVREAHHAGSWYSSSAAELDADLSGFLAQAADASNHETASAQCHRGAGSSTDTTRLRAIICPHAGFSYSGPTAAHAYQALAKELARIDSPIRSILVLHPSHHEYLSNRCAVSGATRLATPLGDLPVDDVLRQEIIDKDKTLFSVSSKRVDELEHSGEMQYPYLVKLIQQAANKNIQVLPVMCGQLSTLQQEVFGRLLADVVKRPTVLTVVSSDFCHWGERFRFTPMSPLDNVPIHQFIEHMDRRGMSLIELQQPGAFAEYIKDTQNTICGRNAIAVWMRAVDASNETDMTVRFVKYAQSSAVQNMRESSVSYAAAVAYATAGSI